MSKRKLSLSETAPSPRGVAVDKIAKFGWEVIGKPGELRMLGKNEIEIDADYQREVSVNRVRAMASEWNWIACGAIVVSYRDGRYYGVDGQHRVVAAKSRSDISELPCVVYRLSQRQEAQAFLFLNGGKPVSALSKYHASLIAGDETAQVVQGTLDKLGIIAANDCKPGQLKCVALACRLASMSRDDFARVLIFTAELCGKSSGINERLLSGIDYLHKHCGKGLDDKRLSSRLMEAGPGALLDGAGRAAAYFARGGSKVFAQGFLDVINKGLRERYELNPVGPSPA